MSIENRLRTGLSSNASTIAPETERRLEAVQRRHRKWTTLRWSAASAGLLAAAMAVILGIGASPLRERMPSVASPAATSAVPSQAILTGEYAAVLPAGDRFSGRWVLRFKPDGTGTVGVTPPPQYRRVVSGVLYTSAGVVRTNLFEQDTCAGRGLGRYAWNRAGPTLTFDVVDDTCTDRVELLTARQWRETR
jgi:hypothetical protein